MKLPSPKLLIPVVLIGAGIVAVRFWPESPLAVTVSQASSGIVEASVANTRSGTVKACQRSRLSLPMGGQVSVLYVAQGDKVEAGAPLMELWNEDIRATLATAEAQLATAKLSHEASCTQADSYKREERRVRDLYKRQMASAELLDQAETAAKVSALTCSQQETQITQATANVDLQKARLAQTQLRAPFAGIIAEVNAEIGEYATPSPPGVATPPAIDLINPECFYVQAPIDEVDAAQVALDMPVRVTLDAFGDQTFDGHVSRISPYIQDEEKQARTVDVDVRLNELPEGTHLLIGYSADIEVITATSDNTLRIPTELLIDTDHVMLAKDGKAIKQQVELGLTNWTWSEVTGGLSNNDQIINEPGQSDLEDGRSVRVLDTDTND
ncbi:MAG: efflux RND transporter periplasmic adaptor subunit [Thalassolituus sp.]